ncbi:nucleotide-binding protein [Phenylobacterium sp.]|uniref:nucleotide-binding protein n=1 Tax=Phenylobacterium sp. TaxID=1871053 RepID=UPI0025F8CD26|nr:nucleotide-binding protein [Phenylobacterium sp.]MBX3483466.1 nucleotide-binding protein [Phenylobacterium sp.]MCW5759926.1 nucleotide-binding protein [Phenylobacterium sp.]
MDDVNNAILDLQSADYNTYERPLKRLAASIGAGKLAPIAESLKGGVDFDAFVSGSHQGGSMVGSARLTWPEKREKELGLAMILIERGAADPHWFLSFAHHWYDAGSKHAAAIRKITAAVIIPFGRDYKKYVEAHLSSAGTDRPMRSAPNDKHRVFIVHGHEEAPREMVARFLSDVGLEPVILHEQANRGMTVVEKLQANANVGFSVVLLTPDDTGRANVDTDLRPRARQNVILELGYFVGLLGRERVCALRKGGVEIPSDFAGVVYTEFDPAGAWRQSLAQELDAAGYEVDWNKVMRRR